MALFSIFFALLSFFAFLIPFNLTFASTFDPRKTGITLDLIHRHSPLSPVYGLSRSRFSRVSNTSQHPYSHGTRFTRFKSSVTPQSPIQPEAGVHLLKLSIGTPPSDYFLLLDTTIDLTFVQCKPCESCHENTGPIYDPRKSSSYKSLECQSQTCKSFNYSKCVHDNENPCQYEFPYEDGVFSFGNLSTETIALTSKSGRSFDVPNVVFGCGINNGDENGDDFLESQSGLIGLGTGSLSMATQLKTLIDGKFSYCFVQPDLNTTGKMIFGSNAIVSSPRAVKTPFIKKPNSPFYYLTLKSISIGGNSTLENPRFKVAAEAGEKGNFVIVTATAITFLPNDLYGGMVSALKESIKGKEVQGPEEFQLCYKERGLNVPNITLHFKGGSIDLLPMHTFLGVGKGVQCLAILPAGDGPAVLGNLAQTNFHVGYDLEKEEISFLPTDCSQ